MEHMASLQLNSVLHGGIHAIAVPTQRHTCSHVSSSYVAGHGLTKIRSVYTQEQCMQVDVRCVWGVSLDRAHGMHRTLGALAEKCHAFAKALHYKEVEFAQTPETAVESLISINNQLRQPEAAIGILAVAQNDLHMELKVCAPATPCSGK